MNFCTQCGAKLNNGVKFCTQCGAPLKPSTSTPESVLQTSPASFVPDPDPTPYAPPPYPTPQNFQNNKNTGKKVALLIVCVVLAVAIAAGLLLFFLGRGMNRGDDTLGLYDGISYHYNGVDISAKDDWIELKPFGIAKLMLADNIYFARWSVDDEEFLLKQAGSTYEGTLEDGVLVLDLDGFIYTYVHEDADIPDDVDRSNGKGKPATEDTPAPDDRPAPENSEEAPIEESLDTPAGEYSSVVGYWTLKYTEGIGDMSKSEAEIAAMREEMGIEIYLQLYKDGTGVINWEELSEITWDNKNLIGPDNSTVPYTLENGELVVDIEGTLFHFIPGEGIPGEQAGAVLTPNDPEYYEGDYYGWWYYSSVIKGDPELQGYWWDCCMTLDISPDGSGSMIIWDEDFDKDHPLADVDITVSVTDGVAQFMSENGRFISCDVGYGDWMFWSDDAEYDNALGFYTMYTSSDFEIECYFLMRPWGATWDDAAEEDVPYYYSDWYLPLIEEGVTKAPDTIG